jgi:hypothetical protein
MNKQTFIARFEALVNGDDAKAQGEKAYQKALKGWQNELSALEYGSIDLKAAVESAKEADEKSLLNAGKDIIDPKSYITSCYKIANTLAVAEEALKDHEIKIAFVKTKIAAFSSTEAAS